MDRVAEAISQARDESIARDRKEHQHMTEDALRDQRRSIALALKLQDSDQSIASATLRLNEE